MLAVVCVDLVGCLIRWVKEKTEHMLRKSLAKVEKGRMGNMLKVDIIVR